MRGTLFINSSADEFRLSIEIVSESCSTGMTLTNLIKGGQLLGELVREQVGLTHSQVGLGEQAAEVCFFLQTFVNYKPYSIHFIFKKMCLLIL